MDDPGRAGTSAVIGAACDGAGATHGLFHVFYATLDRSLVHSDLVNHCLRERGYEPIAWD